jgi:putative SOS response-associated peptidase YedK
VCGRFTLATPPAAIATVFGLDQEPALQPRYNIAPTQPIAVIRAAARSGKRDLESMRWGLIPKWAKDSSGAARMINARGETVRTKPSFRSAFAARRALIPADGFYEWKPQGSVKQPYYIQLRGEPVFGFAAVWEEWQSAAEVIHSAAIITTSAHPSLAEIHDRMPVILPPERFGSWLDPDFRDFDTLESWLVPCAWKELVYRPVSRRVNSPAHDDQECIR